MNINLTLIKELIQNKEKIDTKEFKRTLKEFLKENVKKNHIDNYIGEYPSIIEPVVLGENVKIGDDVLLGPNVFIGNNSEIGDYDEISNSVILDNVKLGEIFKLDYCIVSQGSEFFFDNLKLKNCILSGKAKKEKELNNKCFSD
jgi:NDP-sugar pyrophosphorylase family protein